MALATSARCQPPGACGVDLYVSVVGRAWTEPGFIAQLKSNPEDVLNTGWGVQLPVGGKVSILTEDEENVYFVCPNDSIEGELGGSKFSTESGQALFQLMSYRGIEVTGTENKIRRIYHIVPPGPGRQGLVVQILVQGLGAGPAVLADVDIPQSRLFGQLHPGGLGGGHPIIHT